MKKFLVIFVLFGLLAIAPGVRAAVDVGPEPYLQADKVFTRNTLEEQYRTALRTLIALLMEQLRILQQQVADIQRAQNEQIKAPNGQIQGDGSVKSPVSPTPEILATSTQATAGQVPAQVAPPRVWKYPKLRAAAVWISTTTVAVSWEAYDGESDARYRCEVSAARTAGYDGVSVEKLASPGRLEIINARPESSATVYCQDQHGQGQSVEVKIGQYGHE